MTELKLVIAGEVFPVTWQDEVAPRTCELARSLLPFQNQMIHVRWSGEACWVPLGHTGWSLPAENATSYPAPGEIVLYPGGASEAELLIPYGPVRFASKAGQLAGNPVLKVRDGLERLAEIGRLTLWKGAVGIRVEEFSPSS